MAQSELQSAENAEYERNTALVGDDESPLKQMQNIEHLSDRDLGFAVRDSATGELNYFVFAHSGVWLHYVEDDDGRSAVHAFETDTIPERLDMFRGPLLIVPTGRMPKFGDDTLDFEEVLNYHC